MSKNPRILFINFSDSGGGAEHFTADLFNHTAHAEMVVSNKTLNSRATTLPENSRSQFIKLINKVFQKFSRFQSVHHFLGLNDSFHHTFERLRKLEAYQNADLVHLNNIHGGWFDLDALRSIDREKPVVWTLHDQWCMTGGEACVFDHKGFQTGDWNTPFKGHYPMRNPYFDQRRKYIAQKKAIYAELTQTVFVPASQWLENCLKNSWVYNPNMNIRTIKNGVDLSVFNPKSRKDSGVRKRILFFNHPSPFKGTEMGMDVLKKLGNMADIYLVGQKTEEVETYKHLGDRIDGRKQMAELFNSVDLLLFPSLTENMPLTVLEAMACGVTVIANKVGGIPEIINDGETGFLSSTNDSENLLHKTREALNANLSPISIRAAEFVKTQHGMEQMLHQYQKLYSELIDRG